MKSHSARPGHNVLLISILYHHCSSPTLLCIVYFCTCVLWYLSHLNAHNPATENFYSLPHLAPGLVLKSYNDCKALTLAYFGFFKSMVVSAVQVSSLSCENSIPNMYTVQKLFDKLTLYSWELQANTSKSGLDKNLKNNKALEEVLNKPII